MLDQQEEFDKALAEAKVTQERVEPSPDELRNGWTTETLSAYLANQKAAQTLRIDPHSALNRRARRPTRCAKYRPLRWRG